jgi:hypothetical protein
LEATYTVGEKNLYGHESSLEGDSSNDEEEDNMQGGGLEELHAWAPELHHVLVRERRSGKRRKVVTTTKSLGVKAWEGNDEEGSARHEGVACKC